MLIQTVNVQKILEETLSRNWRKFLSTSIYVLLEQEILILQLKTEKRSCETFRQEAFREGDVDNDLGSWEK